MTLSTTVVTSDEIVEMFIKMVDGNKRNPWFYRHMNKLSATRQEKIWLEIENRGYERLSGKPKEKTPAKTPNRRRRGPQVSWEKAEITILAQKVYDLRQSDPFSSFLPLLQKAINELPQNRRRTISTAAAAQPVIEQYKEIVSKVSKDAKQTFKLKELVDNFKKDPENLSDVEVVARYAKQVFETVTPNEVFERYAPAATDDLLHSLPLPRLVGFAAERLTQHLVDNRETMVFLNEILLELYQRPQSNGQKPPKRQVSPERRTSKIHVTIFGAKSNQKHTIAKRFGKQIDFNFVSKERKADLLNGNYDEVIMWASFCSHSMQDQIKKKVADGKLHLVYGGISSVTKKLDELLLERASV